MADAGKDSRRALKIKCGSVARLRKEITMYEQEVVRETAKTERMRADGACPHDIKQQARARGRSVPAARLRQLRCLLSAGRFVCSHAAQENVQGESAMMIPDCRMRLESALADLRAAVVRAVSLGLTHPPIHATLLPQR